MIFLNASLNLLSNDILIGQRILSFTNTYKIFSVYISFDASKNNVGSKIRFTKMDPCSFCKQEFFYWKEGRYSH